jgi:hypothetical protein
MAEVRKGMNGLPQAGILAYNCLVKHLHAHGYIAAANTPGLFPSRTPPVTITLVVDDFGENNATHLVNDFGKNKATHLVKTLKSLYTITGDWTGSLYCGLTLAWNNLNHTVDVSMMGYVARTLQNLQHPHPTLAQHAPHYWIAPTNGAMVQYTFDNDTSPAPSKMALTRLEQIIGIFLYYAGAIDSTMLVALDTRASAQTKVQRQQPLPQPKSSTIVLPIPTPASALSQ